MQTPPNWSPKLSCVESSTGPGCTCWISGCPGTCCSGLHMLHELQTRALEGFAALPKLLAKSMPKCCRMSLCKGSQSKILANSQRFVCPVKPYTKEQPNRKRPEGNAPKLLPASWGCSEEVLCACCSEVKLGAVG